mmetsp:Transcript_39206/g.58238  ORF Transcript_39206/g.58238 Transcript_39206/m.58238 type:complete len:155 (-) Transcript_39206:765-1229(-)
MSFHRPATTPSRGAGGDREFIRHVMAVSKAEAALSPQTRVAIAREGMEIENEDVPEAPCDGGVSDDYDAKWRQPRVSLESLTPQDVKRRTGFRDLKHLLAYCAVVYGGNLTKMAETKTKMTWLEEVMLWLEFTGAARMYGSKTMCHSMVATEGF